MSHQESIDELESKLEISYAEQIMNSLRELNPQITAVSEDPHPADLLLKVERL